MTAADDPCPTCGTIHADMDRVVKLVQDCTVELDQLAARTEEVAALRREGFYVLHEHGHSMTKIGALTSPSEPMARQTIRTHLQNRQERIR
jgi:hypothetical protein